MNKSSNKSDIEAKLELTAFARSIQKKQFRFSDWFAEKLIKAVAFSSIAIVILIFIFVFRESLPIFRPETSKTPEENVRDERNIGDLEPEIYSPDVSDVSQELKPETYGIEIEEPVTYGEETQVPAGTQEIEEASALSTLLSRDWLPVSDNPRYGLLSLFVGTLKVTLIAILLAAPLAIMAALYTSMFATKKIREYIKPVIELLAGFPSVVIGFFALMILATFFQNLFGYSSRLNAFIGGFAMALAAIPVIYTLTEDALMAVPKTYIEASLSLGASYRQTAFLVVLPAATPGIFAAVLLGIGRVFGETMIALMATGNAALISINPFESVRTLSATIGAEMAEVVFGDTHYSVLFLIGSLLFIFTFALNALAELYFKNRIMRRFQGS